MSDDALGFPTRESLQLRAYAIYTNRGGEHGCDLDDWLAAEKELKESYLETCFRALSQQAL
jgi:hypothetical protein